MKSKSSYRQRKLRVCYWDSDPRTLNSPKLTFENYLKRMTDNFDIIDLKGLDDPSFHPSDLLVISAPQIDTEIFLDWLNGLSKRVDNQKSIWIPALILTDQSITTLIETMDSAIYDNWYFDIVSVKEMPSIPIRISNLLKIHDHLHELYRYDQEIKSLQSQVKSLEERIQSEA